MNGVLGIGPYDNLCAIRHLEVGSRVKLLSVTPSVHRDKFGGSSPSFKAELIGVGLIEPAAVLQKVFPS